MTAATGVHNETETADVIGESPRWLEIASAVWLSLILVFGVLENSIMLYVFAKNKQFVTTNNIPIIAMLFNCLCMSGLAFSLPITAEVTGGWNVVLNDSWCTIEAFTVYFFGLTSLYLLLLITILRYVTITRPGYSIKLSNTHAVIGVLTSYVTAGGFALCPLLGFGSYGLEPHGTSCGLAWDDRSPSGKVYLTLILVACLLLPVAIMIMSYSSIFKVVRKASIFPTENTASLRMQRQRRKERKLLKLSITMVSAYLLCWTPYAIVSFYITFGNPRKLDPVVTRLPAFLAKSEVVLNPIIYTLQTRPFRTKFYDIIPCRYIRNKLGEADNEETNMQVAPRSSDSRNDNVAQGSGSNTNEGQTTNNRVFAVSPINPYNAEF